MEHKPILSSNLKSAGYDEKERVLEVEFTNGTRYRYTDVPPAVYAGLLQAGSAGTYFHQNVRGQYNYKKV